MEGTKIAKSDHGNTSAIADPPANTNTKDFQSPNKNIEPGFMGQAQMEKYLSQINFKTIDSQQSLQLAIKILKNRDNQDEISALETEALLVATKNMDFFEEMNKVEVNKQLSIHQRCCRVMQYQKLPKGSVVFEAGSRPDKLYIILTGSVNVFVPKTKEQIQKEIVLVNRIARKTMESQTGKDNKRRRGIFLHNNQPSQGTKFDEVEISMKQKAYNVKIARKKLFTQSDSEGSSSSDDGSDIEVESIADDNQNADDEEEQDDGNDEEEADTGKNPGSLLEKLFGGINPEYIEDLNRYLTKGVFHLLYESTVEAGFVFGELGLTKQSLRQRTIICKEDCQFATISRENFSEILNLLKERRRRDKVNFVELNMIPDANREANERVAGMMKKMRAIKGQKIYQEGDSAEKVYLIREGEVTMYVKKGASQRAKEELWNKYNEVSAYLKKPMADNLKLVAVAKLNAGQYFGEEDMLEYNPRKLTAICTTLKAKLYTISRRDLMFCFDDFPILKFVLQTKLKMRADRRLEQKQSYNQILSQSQNNEVKVTSQTGEATSIRQSVQEIFSEDNIKAVKLGLKAKIEANISAIDKPKEKPTNESQILNLTTLQRSENSPSNRILEPITNRTHLTRASSVEQLVEYRNNPHAYLPPMEYQRFGTDVERRKLLLKGLRADVAAKRDKLSSDDVAKMNRMIQSNEKIQKELSKKALPFDDIFPLLKEFTTRENEKKQRRAARVREIIKIKGEPKSFKLPKLDAADLITIHLNSKRKKRSESVLDSYRERLGDSSRFITIASCVDRGTYDSINSPKKMSANESMTDDQTDRNNKKDSIISGIRPLLRGSSVADSGFGQTDTEVDLRYFSVMEVPKNKKDRPTKVSFVLNSRLLGLQTESQGASTFITSNEEPKNRVLNKPSVIEQYESQRKKNNSRFVSSYKERNFLNSVDFYGEEGKKALIRYKSAPKFF